MSRTTVELQLEKGFSVLRMVNKAEDVTEMENDVAIITSALRLLDKMGFESIMPGVDENPEETRKQVKELFEKFEALL